MENILKIIFNIFKGFTKPKDDLHDTTANWYNEEVSGLSPEEIDQCVSDEVLEEKIQKPELPFWAYPVKILRITSKYGWRILRGKKSWHNGTDYTGRNELAYAPCDIIITKIKPVDKKYPVKFEWSHRANKFVYIKGIPKGRAWTPRVVAICAFDENIRFAFKHVDPLVKVGDEISVGDPVGRIGNYGYSMGPHLHQEVHKRKNKKSKWYTVNPHNFFKKKIAEMKNNKDLN